MPETVVPLLGKTLEALDESFRLGPIIEHDGKETRLLEEHRVARLNGLKVDIFADEHPPPHFRVKYQNSTANFCIKDCEMLNGSGEVLRYQRNIREWWKVSKSELIAAWNNTRPADCPVGPYQEEPGN